jgi:hypothetical protein
MAARRARPTAARVARRALALEAVAYRGFLEAEPKRKAEAWRRELLEWLDAHDLRGELEEEERALVEARAGGLDDDAVNLATWRSEGVAVLAWALKLHDLPGHDAQVEVGALGRALGFLKPEAARTLKRRTLRAAREVGALRDVMRTVTWRLRQFGIEQKKVDLKKLATQGVFERLLRLDGLPLVKGDLAFDGRPIVDVAYSEWVGLIGIAQERYQAAAWLCGEGPTYSDVDTPT